MAKKSLSAPSLYEQALKINHLIHSGRALLKNLLLDGQDTAAVRAELADLNRDALKFAELIMADESERQAIQDARLLEEAEALAQSALSRINALVAALAPPVAPWI